MTKFFVVLSLALASASFACAANITLKDGRVLHEAVVVKQDAATVTFRHSAGFSQIEKSKLPESLLAEYPLDAAQAKLEAEQQRQEVQARRAEAERLYTLRLQLAAAAPKPAEVPTTVESQPSADSPTSRNSWVDTYNAESWRLMRHRDRQNHRERDYDLDRNYDQGRTHRTNYESRRHQECSPTAPRPSTVTYETPSTTMTSGVTMTPDITKLDLNQRADVEVPPTDATKSWTPPRRF